MIKLSARLGFWAALGGALTFLIFTVCFVAIGVVNPLFLWSDLNAYVAYVQQNNQILKYLAQAAMLLFGPLYILMVNSIYDYATPTTKPLARAALAFAVVFAALTGLHYFVQITAVRWSVERDQLDGIVQFLQSKPDSALAAVNMLGWTLFFGLSSLLVAPVFASGRLERALRILFVANGVLCLLAGIAFVFDWVVLVFLTINLGMGGAVTAITILLSVFFRHRVRLLPGEAP